MKSDKNTGLTSSLQEQFSRIVIILMMIMILKQPMSDKNTGLPSSLQKQFSKIVIILMMLMKLKKTNEWQEYRIDKFSPGTVF